MEIETAREFRFGGLGCAESSRRVLEQFAFVSIPFYYLLSRTRIKLGRGSLKCCAVLGHPNAHGFARHSQKGHNSNRSGKIVQVARTAAAEVIIIAAAEH